MMKIRFVYRDGYEADEWVSTEQVTFKHMSDTIGFFGIVALEILEVRQ